jgi:hypothetical protein
VRRHVLISVGLITCAAAAAGCGGEDESATRARASTAAHEDPGLAAERAAAEAALAEASPASAWPAEVGSLADAVAAFESSESCLTRMRAAIPTEAAEMLTDVGYDAFLDDVCGGLAALKERSAAGCDGLSTTAARRGCRRRLALITGEPATCPDDAVLGGREPLCLAWARRDVSLCRAVMELDRSVCRAVIVGVEACGRDRGGDHARCEAQVRRYGPSIGDERNESAVSEPSFRLQVARVAQGGTAEGESLAVAAPALSRGVFLEAASGCGWRTQLGDADHHARIGMERQGAVSLRLDIPVADTPMVIPLGITGARMELTTPDGEHLTSDVGAAGNVTVRELRPVHGGAMVVAIDGSLDTVSARVRVRGEVHTYLRDVDPLPPSCGARP